jgi:uridine kinase
MLELSAQICHVVGVAGGTASGKTTFVRRVVEYAAPGRAVALSLDWYYRCHGKYPAEERARINYDHPDAFEIDLLISHLHRLRQGQTVHAPVYDFATHSRAHRTIEILPARLVLVEGILCFHFPELVELFDTTIFIHASDSLRLERRLRRDVAERGRTEEAVLAQWEATVYPMHKQFCEPGRTLAHQTVSGEAEDEYEDAIARLLDAHGARAA